MFNFIIIVMLIISPLTQACMPTPIRDETPEILLTTTRPPPPCGSCPTPVQTINNIGCGLTITPCDENNRLIYYCGPTCALTTQNEPTDVFIDRGQDPVDVICDSSSGRYFIRTPADQIRIIRCD
uniref:Uncharacterized protein n=1 Tax=Panagrolaimus davidi TaxID=227884 RepID=A0A914Q609_9BILA